jgi:hypothetical protein
MSAITAKAVSWTESGLVPDTVIRAGIRRLLESKRKEIHSGDVEHAANTMNRFVAMMNESPIALLPDLANEQHYEVPAGFFSHVMGDHLKYSCCYWPNDVSNLSEAEAAAAGFGLRLGVAVALDCGVLSKRIRYVGFQFDVTTRIHPQAGKRPVHSEHRRHCL